MLRGIARESYDARRELTPREKEKSGLRYTQAESDSLAEHNIPPALIGMWRQDRHNIPYDMGPDYRAERFMERYGEDTAEHQLSMMHEAERMLTPEYFTRAEEEARLAREYLEEEEDEVPF